MGVFFIASHILSHCWALSFHTFFVIMILSMVSILIIGVGQGENCQQWQSNGWKVLALNGKKLGDSISIVTGILYLSRLIVKEKQHDITLVFSGSGFFNKHEVSTAFCPASKAILPYFCKHAWLLSVHHSKVRVHCENIHLPIIHSRFFGHKLVYAQSPLE